MITQTSRSSNRSIAPYLNRLKASRFSGEISTRFSDRLVLSTDNSIYEVVPDAILFPKSHSDIEVAMTLAATPAFSQISFTARGGGTGTNGQSLNRGIIVDMSKFMTAVGALDSEQNTVSVQPGVILDQLNTHLKPEGVFFPPSVAPSNRATLGGMINTDACGKGSRIYGRTSDHLFSLQGVWADGTAFDTEEMTASFLGDSGSCDSVADKKVMLVRQLLEEHRAEIKRVFPKLIRFMTGYNLEKTLAQETLREALNYLISGSEGTLAMLTGAKLKVSAIPEFRALAVILYPSFELGLADADRLVGYNPLAVEILDDEILSLSKSDQIYEQVKSVVGPNLESAKALSLIEFIGDDQVSVNDSLKRLVDDTGNQGESGVSVVSVVAESDAHILWQLRKKGVGLLGNKPGFRQPSAFIEDTAVPPASLKDYIQSVKKLLSKHGLSYGIYGHIDAGCLHIRPALDMRDDQDQAKIKILSDEIVSLVKQYGGVMWGEHGRGYRAAYTPTFFGETLYGVLRDVKHIFDPNNRLNPGKICTPSGHPDKVVELDQNFKGSRDKSISEEDYTQFQSVVKCNGNGECFDYSSESVMCPSYHVTQDRVQSPKGRATLLREWIRSKSLPEKQVAESGLLTDLYKTLKTCLSCKACVSKCPIHVDIPKHKSDFLEAYHRQHRRPLRDYLSGYIEVMLPLIAGWPRLFNFLAGNFVSSWALRCLGLVNIPRLSAPCLKTRLRQLDISKTPNPEKSDHTVFILQDAFTSFFEADVVEGVVRLLQSMGKEVVVLPYSPNGKSFHIQGFL
ncbi:MAG: FAD/FMN-containing dehydrogenase/ferredoxin, partial [Candidatus Marinamargulisbacteria bacterium]